MSKCLCPTCMELVNTITYDKHVHSCTGLLTTTTTTTPGFAESTLGVISSTLSRPFSFFRSYVSTEIEGRNDFGICSPTELMDKIEVLSTRGREEDAQMAVAEREEKRRDEEEKNKRWLMEALGINSSTLHCFQCESNCETESMTFLENCIHYFCKVCLEHHVNESMDNVEIQCLIESCHVPLNQQEIKDHLTRENYEMYLEDTLNKAIGSPETMLARCPNEDCNYVIECIENGEDTLGNIVHPRAVPAGVVEPSDEAVRNRHIHRFRCTQCSTTFCNRCSVSPYHEGHTCEEYDEYTQADCCRFCSIVLTDQNTYHREILSSLPITSHSFYPSECLPEEEGPSIRGREHHHQQQHQQQLEDKSYLLSVDSTLISEEITQDSTTTTIAPITPIPTSRCCTSHECILKLDTACDLILDCGHLCMGVSGFECMPCIHPDCITHEDAQSCDSLCNICYLVDLGCAPCITLPLCSHVFHHQCLVNQVKNGWTSSRITFNFLNCALCQRRLSGPPLEKYLLPIVELEAEVQRKAMERLRVDALANDEVITSKYSRFYNDPEAYAMHTYCFYSCFYCKRPYYGGKKDCAAVDMDSRRDFDPKELVCGSCSSRGSDVCTDHGTEFVEYKCRYCCNIAVWFCWGTTHFCQDCHANAATLLTKSKEELPPCSCAFIHPPNGEEFSLGCAYCRMLLMEK